MVIVFILSSIPGEIDNERLKILTSLDPRLQNFLHIPLFGLLQYLWLFSFSKHGLTVSKTVILSLPITLGYGFLDEFHQYFIPGRYASLMDLGLDLLGIALATMIFFAVNPLLKDGA